MQTFKNYQNIKKTVQKTAENCGRESADIKIISVSKTFSSVTIQEAINSGIQIFGENKIQEARKKSEELTGDFSLHMIGPVQSNKAKDSVLLFDLIHSISKIKTAKKIHLEAKKINKTQDILIQVNTSKEESKSGVFPEDLFLLYDAIQPLENINILGLMTMAPYTENKSVIRKTFRDTKNLLTSLNDRYSIELKELSMGMSNDFTVAIEEGSTMVRIGSLIFGQRSYT